MKKIQLYRFALLAMLPAFVLTSCRFEDDDYFSEPAALRIEHQGEKLKNILAGSENGWVVQYFCGSDVACFEGFNLFGRFDKNSKVTFASDHRLLRNGNAGKYTEANSVYSILYEDGLVLSFNVWNDVLTPFSDPVEYWSAPTYVIKDGIGMHGDYNFVVMSQSDNEIILRGQRHQAEVRLLKADRDWKTYISDTETMRTTLTSSTLHSYYIKSADKVLYLDNDGKGTPYLSDAATKLYGKFRFCDDLDVKKAVKGDSISFVYTPNGIRFEKRDTVGKATFQELTMAEDKTCLKNEDGSVQMMACWDRDIATRNTIWYMPKDNLSSDLQALWDALATALKAEKSAYVLQRIGLGQVAENDIIGLIAEWRTNKFTTATTRGCVELKRSNPAYAQLTLDYAEDANLDPNFKNRNAAVQTAARNLAKAFATTYQLTPESYFMPSVTKAQQVDGSKAFTLTQTK